MKASFPPTPAGHCPVCTRPLDMSKQSYCHHGYSRVHIDCIDDIKKTFRLEQWREGHALIYKYVRREAP